MIRLERNRASIPAEYTGLSLIRREQELLTMAKQVASGQLSTYGFTESYWKKAKYQLIEESHGKCAYCESPTNIVAYGDVEHFRPKSLYWWLAYCYDNYLYACQICNQKHKKDKFPIQAGQRLPSPDPNQAVAGTLGVDPLSATNVLDQFKHTFDQEQADLPNPYYTDPEPYFIWQADDVPQEVEILPNPAHPEAGRVHQAVEDCYGLNRKEIKGLRYQIYKTFEVIKLANQQPQISAALRQRIQQQIDLMKASSAPFAGMIRYFDAIL